MQWLWTTSKSLPRASSFLTACFAKEVVKHMGRPSMGTLWTLTLSGRGGRDWPGGIWRMMTSMSWPRAASLST